MPVSPEELAEENPLVNLREELARLLTVLQEKGGTLLEAGIKMEINRSHYLFKPDKSGGYVFQGIDNERVYFLAPNGVINEQTLSESQTVYGALTDEEALSFFIQAMRKEVINLRLESMVPRFDSKADTARIRKQVGELAAILGEIARTRIERDVFRGVLGEKSE